MTHYDFFDYAVHITGRPMDFSLFGNFHRIDKSTNAQKVWSRYAGCLVLEGSGTYKDWNGDVHAVGPGSFVHHHPRKYHDIKRAPQGWIEHTIGFDQALYDHFVALNLLDGDCAVSQVPNTTALIACFDSIHSVVTQAGTHDAMVMHALIMALRELALQSQATHSPDLLESAKGALAQDLKGDVDLQELARDCQMGYTHFRTQFKKRFGLSPSAFRKAQRMEKAKLRLEASPLPIATLAEDLGYNDQFAFSKEFKRTFGVSPKRYNLEHAPE